MFKTEFFGFSNKIEEFVADGGFAAAKLQGRGADRFGGAQVLQHARDLLCCGFVDVSCCGGIGEADGAFEVAAVRHVDDC